MVKWALNTLYSLLVSAKKAKKNEVLSENPEILVQCQCDFGQSYVVDTKWPWSKNGQISSNCVQKITDLGVR